MKPLILLLLVWVSTASPPVDANGIRLTTDVTKGSALYSNSDYKKGDVLCTLPLKTCLLSHHSGSIKGLQGQTDWLLDIVGDLRNSIDADVIESTGRSWDIQLSCALLDATAGTSLAVEGSFWDSYTSYLPKPHELLIPFCYDTFLLDEIQSDDIKANIIEQKKRLHNLFPLLSDRYAHRITASSVNEVNSLSLKNSVAVTGIDAFVPDPLTWAFAVVRSRCVHLLPDYYCMLPVVDMANHGFKPNAEFAFLQQQEQEEEQVKVEVDVENLTVCLVATRDLMKDEEVTISYGDAYNNRRLFSQYGFIIPANPHDRIDWNSCRNISSSGDGINISNSSMGSKLTVEVLHTISTSLTTVLKEAIAKVLSVEGGYERSVAISLRIHAIESSLAIKIMQYLRDLTDCDALPTSGSILNYLVIQLDQLLSVYPTSLPYDEELLSHVQRFNSSSDYFYHLQHSNAYVNRKQLELCVSQRIERKLLLTGALLVCKAAMTICK